MLATRPERANLEIAARQEPDLLVPLARRLYQHSLRADLPEFIAWALIYQAEAGDLVGLATARAIAARVSNPALHERAAALDGLTWRPEDETVGASVLSPPGRAAVDRRDDDRREDHS